MKEVNQQYTLKLSAADSALFVNLITNSPKPNAKLKAAFERYKMLKKSLLN
jgi:uncharacterized protein (DUF1778 family)